jgi:nucleoside diphosphate kinase
MSVAQAEEFYRPVEEALRKKFMTIGAPRAAAVLTRECGFDVPDSILPQLSDLLAPQFAKTQFESIVNFMTGYKPSECSEAEKGTLGREGCLALVYDGVDAVQKIRSILGPTDPSKAKPGSVRREFGSDIMMNAAHASDSPENAEREMRIIKVEEDTIKPLVDRYYGSLA